MATSISPFHHFIARRGDELGDRLECTLGVETPRNGPDSEAASWHATSPGLNFQQNSWPLRYRPVSSTSRLLYFGLLEAEYR